MCETVAKNARQTSKSCEASLGTHSKAPQSHKTCLSTSSAIILKGLRWWTFPFKVLLAIRLKAFAGWVGFVDSLRDLLVPQTRN